MYLLPLKAGSKMFVQARIDPIIESNKALEHTFSRTNNVVQKQDGSRYELVHPWHEHSHGASRGSR
jgi:hypothetical protein